MLTNPFAQEEDPIHADAEVPLVELDDESSESDSNDDADDNNDKDQSEKKKNKSANFDCVECTMQFARESQLRQHVK